MSEQEKSLEQTAKELEVYLDLFEHEGWTKFIDGLKEQLEKDREASVVSCADNDSWQQFRGHAYAVDAIIGMSDRIQMNYEDIQEAIAERDSQPDEEEEDEYPL